MAVAAGINGIMERGARIWSVVAERSSSVIARAEQGISTGDSRRRAATDKARKQG